MCTILQKKRIVKNLTNLGNDCFEVGNYHEAKLYYEKAIEQMKTNGGVGSRDPIFGLATVYQKLGDKLKSWQYAEMCNELPDYWHDDKSEFFQTYKLKPRQFFMDRR